MFSISRFSIFGPFAMISDAESGTSEREFQLTGDDSFLRPNLEVGWSDLLGSEQEVAQIIQDGDRAAAAIARSEADSEESRRRRYAHIPLEEASDPDLRMDERHRNDSEDESLESEQAASSATYGTADVRSQDVGNEMASVSSSVESVLLDTHGKPIIAITRTCRRIGPVEKLYTVGDNCIHFENCPILYRRLRDDKIELKHCLCLFEVQSGCDYYLDHSESKIHSTQWCRDASPLMETFKSCERCLP